MAFVTTKPGITAGLFKSFYMPAINWFFICVASVLLYHKIYGAKKTVNMVIGAIIFVLIYNYIKLLI